jgi:hypothetical protein
VGGQAWVWPGRHAVRQRRGEPAFRRMTDLGDIVFWRRISSHRALAARNVGRWAATRTLARLPLVVREPERVVREPESDWWNAQRAADESITVAVVPDGEPGSDDDPVLNRLATIAGAGRLVVVAGWSGAESLIAGLIRLLDHQVMVLPAAAGEQWLWGNTAVAARALRDGSLPILLSHAGMLHPVAADLSSRLRAEHVVGVLRAPGGAALYPVWHRHPASCV